MKNIFISCFVANPNKGSEFAVGWNIPLNLSKNTKDRIFVFIGTYLGNGFGNFDGLNKNKIPKNLIFIKVEPNFKVKFFNFLNHYFNWGFMFYPALKEWNKLVLRRAIKLSKKYPPSLTHQLCPIGFREPGYLYKLNVDHIWGPIGGAQQIELKSFKSKNVYYFKSLLKNYFNKVQVKSNRVQEAISKTKHIIFSNSSNKHIFEKFYTLKGSVISETACYSNSFELKDIKTFNPIRLLFVGSLIPRKNILFLLDLMKELNRDRFTLNIIGSGPLEKKIISFIKNYNLINVNFIGKIEYSKINNFYSKNDLLLMPSHVEANTNVMFEGFLNAVPIVAFNRDGFHDQVKNMGILIDDLKNYKKNLHHWKTHLIKLSENPEEIDKMRKNIMTNVADLTWDAQSRKIIKIYNEN